MSEVFFSMDIFLFVTYIYFSSFILSQIDIG